MTFVMLIILVLVLIYAGVTYDKVCELEETLKEILGDAEYEK